MKKSILRITMMLLLLATIVPPTTAKDKAPKPTTEAEAAKAKVWISRLDEINAMDKSNLSRSEKRTLRKEVRVIEKNLNSSGGVYLSVGAIIVIILLLIILL